jgi:DNA-directed RNA polymerase beta' subunit
VKAQVVTFDGDEMNAHIPQSIEAATELREIAAVPLQIVSPRESVPIVSVVQDTLVGTNRFTKPDVFFTRREAMNLLVHAKRWNGRLPEPAVTDPVPKWTGQQLLSTLLPPIRLDKTNGSYGDEDRKTERAGQISQNRVKILNGEILQGVLDKSIFSKHLLHTIFNDYGPEMTVDFLDSLQAMIANYLMNSGFSVGISDLIADEETNAQIIKKVRELTSSIEDQILQLHTGLFENSSGRSNQEEFEAKIMGTLNKAVGEAGKIGLQSLSSDNRMTNMVKAGSKGSEHNVSQMVAVLGQQGIEGKRVPNGLQHRTLPHFKRFDDSAQARGFISSSFIKGLQPHEFFFHAMAGREGLIDTAVKSVTGDTEIVVLENGQTKWTAIGPWIDSLLNGAEDVEHSEVANQELLNLKHAVYIPTCDDNGVVTWGQMTAVTRHDPGDLLYSVTTKSGRSVTVAKSQSLIVWNEEEQKFLEKPSPDVKVGDFLPVTMNLCDPPVVATHVNMTSGMFDLNEDNGIFIGLYLAQGSSSNGAVQIDSSDIVIRQFVLDWFSKYGIASEQTVENVRGHSVALGEFLEKFVGSDEKFVPHEAFGASKEFIRGLLNGYIMGNSLASKRLGDGILFLCSRLGIFGTHETWMETFKTGIAHKSVQDVVKDEVVEIQAVSADAHRKLYDVTVPSTLNFQIANGTVCRDTAETGYMQRQIRVALEDLVSQHDGSVRDLQGNLLQLRYGEDGINATKLENQDLPLASMSDDDIKAQFTADGDGREAAYIEAVLADRTMLVEKVFGKKMGSGVRYPVHLERMLFNVKASFKLDERPEDQATVTGSEVLDAQEAILAKTHSDNALWSALVRFHLSPQKLQRQGFTKAALDALVEQVVLRHWKSWVEPGQPVGVIAAQSIGEPATQLTLNSVDWDQRIVIAKNGRILTTEIGQFVDDMFESVKTEEGKVQYLENDQIYIPLNDGNDWKAISCDETGKIVWTTLEAVTRHPVINEDGTNTILEVTLASGRTVKATKGDSFLTRSGDEIVGMKGRDLVVGTSIPLSLHMALDQVTTVDTLQLRAILLPSEWLYESEVKKVMTVIESGSRHWFSKNNNVLFTTPYSRGDALRDAFVNGRNSSELKEGCVYPKYMCKSKAHIPESIPLTNEFGFFVGAYIAEGMSNATQVSITNNDMTYLQKIGDFMDTWNVGYHIVAEEKHAKKTNIRGTSTSLVIHSTLLAKVMGHEFGPKSYAKTLPDWVLQAPDAFVAGLIDGYMSGDGYVPNTFKDICACSVSEALITKFALLLSRYGIFGRISSYMPKKQNFASVSRVFKYCMPVYYSQKFAHTFTLSIAAKQDRLNAWKTPVFGSQREEMNHVIWDTVKEIKEVAPLKEWVYDLTVEGTRNFLLENTVCQKDTFHSAGIAAKSNVTRGVPRLKELLKATKNPKAVELSIGLRPDLRNKKEEARRVAQELEFTLLQDLVTTARIYYDPRDDATLIEEDADWLAFLVAYERASTVATAAQEADALSGGAAAAGETKKSPWILRMELDRDRMFGKNITMDDIAFILRTKFGSDLTTLYTDFNSQNLVMRLRLAFDDDEKLDQLNSLKQFQNKVLTATAIRGIPGLRSVNYQKVDDFVELRDGKYATYEQYMLSTDGSNFLDVLCHPDVDPRRVVSSNVHDIYANLGIEATRAVLYREMSNVFEESGTSVNYRHVGILVDKICTKGKLMSIDRYGINKNDIGPLAKMSFEQTEDIALRAALFGERDPVLGISANVMLGAPIRAGTAFTEILLDEAAAIELARTTPEQTVRAPAKGPLRMRQADVDAVLYAEERGDCAPSALRIDAALPPAPLAPIAEEIPDVEITFVDE